MADILQIAPTNPDDRIAWVNEGRIEYVTPTCLALLKEGNKTRIAYMETVDNEIVEVDIDDPDFLGICSWKHTDRVQEIFNSRKKQHG